MSQLLQLIEEAEHRLLLFRGQFLALKAFQDEFEKARRGKAFYVRNDIAWTAMLDSRDMLFVRFASWAKAMYSRGGFWGQIQANCLSHLFVKTPTPDPNCVEPFQDPYLVESARRQAFQRRFPDAALRGSVRASDVQQLKATFVHVVKPIVDDRDSHRAHPFQKDAPVSTAMLGLEAIEKALEYCQNLLNDLRLIAAASTTAYHDRLTEADPASTAHELVDLVLFGSADAAHNFFGHNGIVHRQTGLWPYEIQPKFYERVHELNDVDAAGRLFNDGNFIAEHVDTSHVGGQ